MRVIAVPCLKDNYAYLVVCDATGHAAVVDPSQAAPVSAALAREELELKAIWNTHHHWDHTGGNKDLLAIHPTLEVIGHASDKGRVPGQSRFVEDGDRVSVGDVEAQIIFNPGHTSGAISYYIEKERCVFTGDTLFGAGCGRMFEGTAPQMHASLMRLAALPPETSVYCGHEYTANNLRFAAAVEPNSEAIAERMADVKATRERGEPTVPFSIEADLLTNPFLRAATSTVADSARANHDKSAREPAAVFGALRAWKDEF